MATTTPNFGWPVPTSTDLVKDGATAIEALGDGIDTSLVDLKGGTTGQILAKASGTDMDFSWITNDQGDITGVTAGTGLTGGGTSGAVTLNVDPTYAGFTNMVYAKNAIINGGLDIWQRGTTFTNPTVSNYTADRFMINRAGDVAGATVSRTTSAPTGFQYAMNWQRTAGNTGTQNMEIYYGLESNDSYRFAGQTATLSFYAKKGANYSGGNLNYRIASGTATDAKPYAYTTTVATSSATLTTSYQRFSVTGTFGSNITQAFFNVSWVPTGTAGADDAVYITGVQLELGSTATPFTRNGASIQGELAACQRYYFRTNVSSAGGAAYQAVAFSSTTTNAFILLNNPVAMRVIPTSIDFSAICFTDPGVADYAITGTTLQTARSTGLITSIAATVASGLTATRFYYCATTSSSGYIGVNAEL